MLIHCNRTIGGCSAIENCFLGMKGKGMDMKGYLVTFGIAMLAIFVANNVDAVGKIVARKG